MSKYLEAYTALSTTSPRTEVSAVLQSLIDAGPFQIDDAKRKELVQTIIDDVTKCNSSGGKKTRLTMKDVTLALQAVKALGKNPAGSEVIAISSNLSALLALSNSFKNDCIDASNEALRCVANALLLIDVARVRFIQKDVNGGEICLEILEKSTVPERLFLTSRIMFLCTVSVAHAHDYIKTIVERKPPGHASNIIEIIGAKLDLLSKGIVGSAKLAREAMTDLLKFAFNLLLHYPKIIDRIENPNQDEAKIMGDCWSDRLDGILPPLLRAFNTLPPTHPAPITAPMTHVIHALITVPITPSLHSKWFPPPTPSRNSPRLSTSSKKGSRDSTHSSPESVGRVELASDSRSSSPKEMKQGAFDRAFSALTAGRRSLSRASSPHLISSVDVLLRAYDLLDFSLGHYFPGTVEPDDASVRERCRSEGEVDLEDVLIPLVLLITRICIADESSRIRMREWILPEDLDRTSPLEGRSDFLGRTLRILASVRYTRLKPAAGEMLYAICDSDAGTLAAYVGYGNVAGFLFQKGVLSAPSRPTGSAPTTTPSGVPINPITGVAEVPVEHPEMSDEEKEREAEKLFVLFDRLEKSGAIPKEQNPVRKAIQKSVSG